MKRLKEPLVSEAIRELYHYTSLDGLKGIVESQQLRATRFDKLNDSTEVRHFYSYLGNAIRNLLSKAVRQKSRESSAFRMQVARAGGIKFVSENDAVNLMRRFYEVTFVGDDKTPAFAVPFITSFCSHDSDDGYTKRNGLLSQWRAYGTLQGRFALVFDARKLEALLSEEVKGYQYSFLNISDVIYDTENLDFSERFSELIELLELDWAKHALGEGSGAPEHIFNKFIECAVRLKHQAFREEREFRIVSCPMSDQLDNFFKVELGAHLAGNLPVKQVGSDGRGRPFITLFRGEAKSLPIRRILVGPHPNQNELIATARAIVRDEIQVYASNTPYLG